jgi:predicted TIM-barrel fold metal-dependent hydrolase
VPYALARSSAVLAGATKGQRSVAETVKAQVHVTTSGYFTTPPFECCCEVVGLERMMYSVDYPFSPNTKGKAFLEELNLEEDEMEALVWGNAAKVLRM